MNRLRVVVALVVLGAAGVALTIGASTAAGAFHRSKTGTIAFSAGAAPATAARFRTRNWASGRVQGGGTFFFKARVRRHNRVSRVIFIRFDVRVHCQNFTGTIDGEAEGGKVRHHRFVGKATDATGAKVFVRGKFGRKYRHARGTIRIHGNVGTASNCETGKLHWTATETGL